MGRAKMTMPGIEELSMISRGPIHTNRGVLAVLRSSPMHLPLLAWRFKFTRTSLSPFVLAYLTKYPGGPEALDKWLKSPDNTDFSYMYCCTTRLPVVGSRISTTNWGSNYFLRSKKTILGQNREAGVNWVYNAWAGPARRVIPGLSPRDSAFVKKLAAWKRQEASPEGITDEYVRKFGRSAITKKAWAFLKVMVDAYV